MQKLSKQELLNILLKSEPWADSSDEEAEGTSWTKHVGTFELVAEMDDDKLGQWGAFISDGTEQWRIESYDNLELAKRGADGFLRDVLLGLVGAHWDTLG